jgi:hypothetical protein
MGGGRKRKVVDPSVSPTKKSPKQTLPKQVQGQANNKNQENDASDDFNEELGCPHCSKVFKSNLVLKVHLGEIFNMLCLVCC